MPKLRIFTAVLTLTCAFITQGKPFSKTYEENIITENRRVAKENLIFYDGFEAAGFRFIVGNYTGPQTGPLWAQAQLQGKYSARFVNKPVRSGRKSIRFEWRKANLIKGNNTSKKAMIHYGKVSRVEGAERWYGFSMYMPEKDFPVEPKYNVVLFQLHATPDRHKKEPWRVPLYDIGLRKGNLVSHYSYDFEKISPKNDNIRKNRVTTIICKQQDLWNKWTDIVVHVRLSIKGRGILQVWRDGKLIIDLKNLNNAYNDQIGPYPSWGIYSYNGKDQRIIFFDEIYIGNEKANYYNVAPGKPGNTQKIMQEKL